MKQSGTSFPDPIPWLEALAPDSDRAGVASWAHWIRAFVTLSDKEWNHRNRLQALEAVRAGRTARVPCGPHPQVLVGSDGATAWYTWAIKPGEERFEDASWKESISPWAYQVAAALGLSGAWRRPHIDAFLMAIYLMCRLEMLHLPNRVHFTRVLKEELVSVEERRKGVWRECVQIRQHLADSLPLARDLPRTSRALFKAWWLTSLEWTRLAERAGDALWESPVSLPMSSLVYLRWQRWFGKLAFR